MSTGWKKNGSPPKSHTQLLTIARKNKTIIFELEIMKLSPIGGKLLMVKLKFPSFPVDRKRMNGHNQNGCLIFEQGCPQVEKLYRILF